MNALTGNKNKNGHVIIRVRLLTSQYTSRPTFDPVLLMILQTSVKLFKKNTNLINQEVNHFNSLNLLNSP